MQPDLLKWRPDDFEIIPFPANGRVDHIRRTADRIYNSRTNREAEDYWRRAVDGLSRQMGKAGVSSESVEIEVRTFQDCVQSEIMRIGCQPCRPGGDAA